MGFEDCNAVGTDIESGVGQAVVRGRNGVLFGQKGVGCQIVELCLRASALCLLSMIRERLTLALKGVDLMAEQATARKSVLTRFNCILT